VTARIEPLRPDHAASLGSLFETLVDNDDEPFFHPHPLTAAEAFRRTEYAGADYYVAAVDGDTVAGYGMLRGWDEGYEVPSLGIAVRPDLRGTGLALDLMEHLHRAAWERGAPRIRLTVVRENERARRFFESLGYRFDRTDQPVSIGFLDRPAIASTSDETPNR
jgi:GNAT superfamily N-acetyltransferase